MAWSSLDYDCRNLFVNELKAILAEPKKVGFSLFFHHVDEYLSVRDRLSPEIVAILTSAHELRQERSQDALVASATIIYDRFISLPL